MSELESSILHIVETCLALYDAFAHDIGPDRSVFLQHIILLPWAGHLKSFTLSLQFLDLRVGPSTAYYSLSSTSKVTSLNKLKYSNIGRIGPDELSFTHDL